MRKYPRILYFIKGVLPSDEAQDVADTLGPNVAFRNANFVAETGALEKCDGVAGEVPARYKEAYPTAEEALKISKNKAAENKKAREEAKKTNSAKASKAVDWKPNA